MVKQLFKKYTLALIFTLIFIFLTYGVWVSSGVKYLRYLMLFYSSFIVSYVFFYNGLKKRVRSSDFNWKGGNIKEIYWVGGAIALIAMHLLYLGYMPTFKSFGLATNKEVALVRSNIAGDSGVLFNYISSFLIKAILPFTLLYLYIKKKIKLLIVLTSVTSFYTFSLMQKSLVLTAFLPVIVYALLKKNYKVSALYFGVVAFVIISLTYVANPNLKQDKQHKIVEQNQALNKKEDNENALVKILYGLERRVILTPGKMVAIWFEYIPEKLPYAGVAGYRPIAKIMGKEHVDYGKALYPIVYPEKAELKGTLNAAGFMYEYAYFGKFGLLLSGVLIGFVISFVEILFGNDFEMKLAINLYSILILSSGSLTTLLFSGGWGMMVLFYLLFLRNPKSKIETSYSTKTVEAL